MKLYIIILSASALFLSTPAFASTSSERTPEESRFPESSTKQKLFATKIDIPEANKPHEAPSSRSHSINHHRKDKLERETVEAQVSLENVEIDDLTDDETLFFERTMKQAVEMARTKNHAGDEDEVTLGAVIVENGHGPHKSDRRNLRGSGKEDRALGMSRFSRFNIYTIIELYGCHFCLEENSYASRYYERRRIGFWYSSGATIPFNERNDYFDASDLHSMYGNRYGGGRSLGESDNVEDILCDLLREGPFECFQSVERCVLEVSKW